MGFPFTHAEVFGEDPVALAAFYREVLGWTVTQAEGLDYWRIAAATGGAAAAFAGGIARRPDFMPKGWLPYACVDSLDWSRSPSPPPAPPSTPTARAATSAPRSPRARAGRRC
jgi:predicted enzyme related to lactoylglutathione lyase